MAINRNQVAQEAAEYIASKLNPAREKFEEMPGATIHYADDKRPPTSVEEIKQSLLDGNIWISWMDDRVTAAMREIHGDPTGMAQFFNKS